jgi:membrane protease YdiL (CAAX protease family)
MNKKYFLLLLQVVISSLCFPIFMLFGKIFAPLPSFVFSFLSYWILITVGTLIMVLFDEETGRQLRGYLLSAKYKPLLLLNFVPVLGVLFVVFIPNLAEFNITLISAVLVIAIFNGILEEVFWRGFVLSRYASSNVLMAVSTLIFGLFHFAFLFLPLTYQGGAINLVGGAAFMGALWLVVSKFTRNITFTIIAHILVNFFAFSGLFLDNNLM